MAAAIAPEALTAADRCDRCGARAYVRAALAHGGELYFCAHHARTYAPALHASAAVLHDETDTLSSTSASAPDGER